MAAGGGGGVGVELQVDVIGWACHAVPLASVSLHALAAGASVKRGEGGMVSRLGIKRQHVRYPAVAIFLTIASIG